MENHCGRSRTGPVVLNVETLQLGPSTVYLNAGEPDSPATAPFAATEAAQVSGGGKKSWFWFDLKVFLCSLSMGPGDVIPFQTPPCSFCINLEEERGPFSTWACIFMSCLFLPSNIGGIKSG